MNWLRMTFLTRFNNQMGKNQYGRQFLRKASLILEENFSNGQNEDTMNDDQFNDVGQEEERGGKKKNQKNPGDRKALSHIRQKKLVCSQQKFPKTEQIEETDGE